MARIPTWLLAGALALSFGSTTVHAESTWGPLTGKKLRYMIGAENPGKGHKDEIVEVGYDWSRPAAGRHQHRLLQPV